MNIRSCSLIFLWLLLIAFRSYSQEDYFAAVDPVQAITDDRSGAIGEHHFKTFAEFSHAFDRAFLEISSDGILTAYCCDDINGLPPVGAIIGGTVRAGYEQLKYNIWRNSLIVFQNKKAHEIPYRRYFVGRHEWRNEYFVTYEELPAEPSLLGRLKDNTLAGLDLAAVVPSAGTVNTMVARTPGVFTVDMIKRITEKFGNLKCIECADEIVKNLKKQGISGKVVQYQTLNEAGKGKSYNLMSKTSENLGNFDAISTSGMHRGVLVDGMVYDNIHKAGIDFDSWIADFESLAPRFEIKIINEF